jgi:hypothetical protein
LLSEWRDEAAVWILSGCLVLQLQYLHCPLVCISKHLWRSAMSSPYCPTTLRIRPAVAPVLVLVLALLMNTCQPAEGEL